MHIRFYSDRIIFFKKRSVIEIVRKDPGEGIRRRSRRQDKTKKAKKKQKNLRVRDDATELEVDGVGVVGCRK